MTETTAELLEAIAAEHESPDRPAPFAVECDLVMKGGITSGIVYPLAIAEIAQAFRLRSIGGTSAGAIAAAAAAAAEAGRQRFAKREIAKDPDGFAELGRLPEHLGAPAAGGRGTRLLAFFKPKAELRPAFAALTAALDARSPAARLRAVIGTLIGHYKGAALLGFVIGTLPLWQLARGWSTLPAWSWILAFAILLAIGCVAWRAVRQLLVELPANGFGICSGMPAADEAAPEEALTVWLSQYFDRLAGQDQAFPGGHKPLTFGDLRAQGIDLQVMTTCLTMGRPFRLPFRDDEDVRENKLFLFRRADFDGLFPPHVVDWMEAKERPVAAPNGRTDFADYRRLPLPDDLPVIVAVRMSLSFPLLLSAIPLYAIDRRKPVGAAPERCWFTDGGVGSNFPIHFFDAPVPTRPTFGLDLGLAENPDDPRVVFPERNGDARLVYWRRFAEGGGLSALVGFLGTVVGVAKDWNHEALSHLPGFRDRIGLIRLTDEEGGLNLTMPEERIARLTAYGRVAGRQFVRRFGDPAKWAPGTQATDMNWENHQLIRLRLALATIGEMLSHLEKGAARLAGGPQDYGRFFTAACGPKAYRLRGRGRLAPDPGTGLHSTQAGLAKSMLDDLTEIARRIAATVAAEPGSRVHPGDGAPKPMPELKSRPRI